MGTDLFGSLTEATCAALLISSTNLIGTDQNGQIMFEPQFGNMLLPLVSTGFGILCSMITSVVGIYLMRVENK